MQRRRIDPATLGAILVALGTMVLIVVVTRRGDTAPLLTEPRPDLDIPLALLGGALGFWSAYRLTALPALALSNRRSGRWAVLIILPAYAAYALATAGERAYERFSFRHGGAEKSITMLVVGKDTTKTKNGMIYNVALAKSRAGQAITYSVDKATFERVIPDEACVALLIEQADNGAERLVRPVNWTAPCPGERN